MSYFRNFRGFGFEKALSGTGTGKGTGTKEETGQGHGHEVWKGNAALGMVGWPKKKWITAKKKAHLVRDVPEKNLGGDLLFHTLVCSTIGDEGLNF